MYRVKNGFIVRKIGEQIMAVPIGAQTSEIHGMIALSESGDCATAKNDVITFLAGLKEQGALQ